MKNYRIALALSLIFALFVPSVQADDEIVWFVHGFVLGNNDFNKELVVLNDIYPNAKEVKLKKWKSPKIKTRNPDAVLLEIYPTWKKAVEISEEYATELAKEIKSLSPKQRKRLILIGHSLGGRIVVRTAAILQKEKIQIKKIILAGSAINNDDRDIAATWTVSKETVENIINTQDGMLAVYNAIGEKHPALGTGYKSMNVPDRFREIVWEDSLCHFGYMYFDVYHRYLLAGCPPNNKIVVPQKNPNLDWSTMNKHIYWDVVDECHGWELQRFKSTGRYRIVDNNNVRRAWGGSIDDNEVIEVFDIVKYRLLQKYGKSPKPEKWWLLINPIQDKANKNHKKNPDRFSWNTIEEYKGWKLQITKKSEKKKPLMENEEYHNKKAVYKDNEKKLKQKKLENKKWENEQSNKLEELKYKDKEKYKAEKKNYKSDKKGKEKEYKDAKKAYKASKKSLDKVKNPDKTECRILDPDNRRRAQGNEKDMRESFDDVKKQIDDLFKRYDN